MNAVGFLICVAAGYFAQPRAAKAWHAMRAWRPAPALDDVWDHLLQSEHVLRLLEAELGRTRGQLAQSIRFENEAREWHKALSKARPDVVKA